MTPTGQHKDIVTAIRTKITELNALLQQAHALGLNVSLYAGKHKDKETYVTDTDISTRSVRL